MLWDDTDWFKAMDLNLRGIAGLWRLWTVPDSIQQYYPVTATSFWADRHFWGGWTLPPHLENVLLHGGSSALFWLLLTRLRAGGAWIAAALFAVHPVMAESVAWMTERKNVLCTFFALAALLAHGAGSGWWEPGLARRPRVAWVLAFTLFVFALLAKISAAVLPGVVLVIGWWRHGHVRWRADGLRVLPWAAAVVPLVLLTSRLEQAQITGGDFAPPLAFLEKVLLAGQLPWFYLGKLAWPRDLCVLYDKWPLQIGAWWQWAGGGALILALALMLWRGWRGVTALTLLFLGALFPVLGFFDVNGMKYAWAADRWAYLPAMAFCAGAGELLHRIRSGQVRRGMSLAVLLACGWLCFHQAALYAGVDQFWQAAIAGSRAPWKARNDYSSQLLDENRAEEARSQLEAALKIQPDYVAAHVNLASALASLGRQNEALEHLDRALALRPENNAATWYNKAVILDRMGRTAETEAALRSAIKQNPDFFAAHNDLGNLLLLAGRQDEAMEQFQTLQRLRPGNANALTSIGNIHFLNGRLDLALASFLASLREDPGMVSTLTNTAWILSTAGDDKLRDGQAAVAHALRAAELTKRQDASVLQVLATAHAEAGDFDHAVAVSGEALELARSQGNESLAASIIANQRLFEKRQPYRTPAR
ncbi:MAG: tetratricopeptide repeat protein [Verrucomicrobiaceae bacterium]|nr:tetratricopeptide repeat protein [Verrucomicrobiaceae bacterium]